MAKLLPDLVIINTELKLTGQKIFDDNSSEIVLMIIGSVTTSLLRSLGKTVF